VHRRAFLKSAAALPALVAWRQTSAQGRRRVIVIGAGLAGLAAALELERAGHDVVILEARTRPGGRVFTMREPFSDGLYAEVGAARIQDTHAFTLQYVKQFNLTLDPFWPTDGLSVTCIGDRRLTGPPRSLADLSALPGDFTAEERTLGHGGSLVKYLFSHLGALGDVAAPDWPATDLRRFEKPIADFCLEQGASPAFVRLIAFGHDLAGMPRCTCCATRRSARTRSSGSGFAAVTINCRKRWPRGCRSGFSTACP
jgi:monoamine oxidase